MFLNDFRFWEFETFFHNCQTYMYTCFYISLTKVYILKHFLQRVFEMFTQNRGQELIKIALLVQYNNTQIHHSVHVLYFSGKSKNFHKYKNFCFKIKGDQGKIKGRSREDQGATFSRNLKSARFQKS